MKDNFKVLGSILLLTGNNIGIAALGVPLATGVSGFFPGLLMTIFIWLLILAISLLYLEAILSLPIGTNFLSLTQHYLGKVAKIILAVFLIVLFYPLISSYFKILLPFLQDNVFAKIGLHPSNALLSFFILIIAGGVIFSGLVPTIITVSLLMAGLFFSLGFLIHNVAPAVEWPKLYRSNWSFIFYPIPVIYSAFGFQAIIPTLSSFLNNNRKQLVLVLFLGTLLPFLSFATLEWLVIGTIAEENLWISFEKGMVITKGLLYIKENPLFAHVSAYFFFFGSISCLITNSLILHDIMADGCKIPLEERKGKKRFILTLFVFLPPAILSLFAPEFFLRLLNFALDFGSILLSFITIAFVWLLRYRYKLALKELLFGGKTFLVILSIIFFYFTWVQGLALLR